MDNRSKRPGYGGKWVQEVHQPQPHLHVHNIRVYKQLWVNLDPYGLIFLHTASAFIAACSAYTAFRCQQGVAPRSLTCARPTSSCMAAPGPSDPPVRVKDLSCEPRVPSARPASPPSSAASLSLRCSSSREASCWPSMPMLRARRLDEMLQPGGECTHGC
jgi:hypothetical protein